MNLKVCLAILFATITCLATQILGTQKNFDNALDEFLKKRNNSKMPNNKTLDRSQCKSNMRQTSDKV